MTAIFASTGILKAVRRVQPSVLLVYLPETQQHLDFINLFAEFLKDSCYLLPYFVDQDVGLQVRGSVMGNAYACLLLIPSHFSLYNTDLSLKFVIVEDFWSCLPPKVPLL